MKPGFPGQRLYETFKLLVVVVFVVADLAADLSGRKVHRVDVGVGALDLTILIKSAKVCTFWAAGPTTLFAAVSVPVTVPPAGGQAGVPAGPLPKLVHKNIDTPPGT